MQDLIYVFATIDNTRFTTSFTPCNLSNFYLLPQIKSSKCQIQTSSFCSSKSFNNTGRRIITKNVYKPKTALSEEYTQNITTEISWDNLTLNIVLQIKHLDSVDVHFSLLFSFPCWFHHGVHFTTATFLLRRMLIRATADQSVPSCSKISQSHAKRSFHFIFIIEFWKSGTMSAIFRVFSTSCCRRSDAFIPFTRALSGITSARAFATDTKVINVGLFASWNL